MTGIGARLKEARVAKGYTLDDLQGMTKIQKRYLSGIENEDYSMMPGAFYIRAFIKQYAEAVDLDADEMLALFKEESGSVPEPERETVTPPLQRSGGLKSNSRLKEIIPKVIVALFIVMIIVIVYILLREKAAEAPVEQDDASHNVPAVVEQPSENPDKEPIIEEDKPVEEPADKSDAEGEPADEENTAGQVEFESASGETSTFKLTDTQQFKLVIKTSGDSWISVTDQTGAERMPQPGGRIMTAGESVEIDAADATSLRIRVGRTNSSELVVNGQSIEYQNELQTQNIIIQKP